LARRIVTDFHSVDAAGKAGEDWVKQFQKGEAPDSIDVVEVRLAEVGQANSLAGSSVKVDKLLFKVGLAVSVTDAKSKREAGSVRINGEVIKEPVLSLSIPATLDIRVGHRMKRVSILL
jgi:tyrosyl-tRNA synthetase